MSALAPLLALLPLLSAVAGQSITLCPPPKGDGRGFLFYITPAPSNSTPFTFNATMPPYSALLSINLGTPAAYQAWYDKSCGYPFHTDCLSPFNPGTAALLPELAFPIYGATTASGLPIGLGLVLPGWAYLEGDQEANALSVGILPTTTLAAAPYSVFPSPYTPGPPGMTLSQITTPFALTSGVVQRATPLPALCNILFPGSALGGSGFFPPLNGLPANLPSSIATNPMVPSGSIFLDPTEFFLPGAAAGAPAVIVTSPPAAQWPLPLPLGVPNPPTLYSAANAYALGNIVSTLPALAGGALPGPFYQVVNQLPYDNTQQYTGGDLVQFNNVIYRATATTLGVAPTAPTTAFVPALTLPGPASPATSPAFAAVPTAAGVVTLYLPSVATPLLPGAVVVVPVVPGGPVAPVVPVVPGGTVVPVAPVVPGVPAAPATATATATASATPRPLPRSPTVTPPAAITSSAWAAGLSMPVLLLVGLLMALA